MVNSSHDIAVAVRACNAGAVPGILEKLTSFERAPSVDNDNRFAMLKLARALVNALETPRETMIKHNWAQPACHTAIVVCYNAGVFQALADGYKTVDEIANKVGMNSHALARLMKHLAAMDYILETGADKYAPTNFSNALTIPIIGDGYPALAGGAHVSFSRFSEYMQATSYANPSDGKPNPYQFAFRTEMNMFEYMHAHPPLGMQFDNHMSGYRQGRPSWMDRDFYPVEERLFKDIDTSPETVLLVDVGGGQGHDLAEFLTKHPSAPGRLVLQDTKVVIDGIQQLDGKIECMVHDFLTAQPLEAARAYYMHSVLHDWTDDVCKQILKQIAGAMKPGYSKLLINENIIPATGANWEATALDITMMTLFGAQERTSSEWQKLLEDPSIGLKIVRVWSVNHSQESLIECELA